MKIIWAERKRYVRGTFSNWVGIISGVPQSSFLGPLLLIAYANDLSGLESYSNMFVDDAEVMRKGKE